MFRPSPSAFDTTPTRRLVVAQAAAFAVALVATLAGVARADDVGDLIEFQPQSPARAAEVNQNFADVKAAVNSKSSDGMDFASDDGSMTLSDDSSQPTIALSVTLTAPGPGFIKVDFSSYLAMGHTQEQSTSYVVCALKTDEQSPESATGRLVGSRRFVPVLAYQDAVTHYPHVDTMGVLEVGSAGSYTINAVCYRKAGGAGATLHYRTLTATYHSDRL